MTQEEKAKRYDEVLDRARYYQKENGSAVISAIFPELQEKEDERIRKELIFYLGDMPEDTELRNGVTNRDVLVWLEKQGEQKPVISYDAIREGIVHFGITQYQITNWLKKYVDVEKQVEQNTNEPKFKVRDWIVRELDNSVHQVKAVIENISNGKYGYDLTSGGYISSQDANFYHLWTIEDAKAGDVLATKDAVFIVKYIDHTLGLCKSYCEVICNCELGLGFDFAINSAHPATKEQRDKLEKAMADAGYTFDFEKKELKKIEDDEWSEEDAKHLNDIIEFGAHDRLTPNDIAWLKSLKDRYTWKPTWEQLDALEYHLKNTNENSWQYKETKKLYDQLKRL